MARSGLGKAALSLALLGGTLAGCRSEAPRGMVRLKTGSEGRGHRFFPKGGKLLFLAGEYPFKTRLCAYDLATGKLRRWSFPEHRLLGEIAYLERSGSALVHAEYDPGGSRAEKKLLQVALADGSVLRELRLAPEARLSALGNPAWSDQVFLVLQVGPQAVLKTFDPRSGAEGEAVPIGAYPVAAAAFLDADPRLALYVKDRESSRLVVYDLFGRKVVRELPMDRSVEQLRPAGTELLAALRAPGETRETVALLDLEGREPRPLGIVEGEVESLLPAGKTVYALAMDLRRPRERNDRGFHPRDLHILDASGTRAPETVAWTKRGGALFGFEEKAGRLLLAVTQPASAWAVPAGKESLSGAARELDRRAGEFWTVDDQAWILWGLLLAIIGWGVVVKLMRPSCKSCG